MNWATGPFVLALCLAAASGQGCCPAACDCLGAMITCSRRGLTAIPDEIVTCTGAQSTTFLDLSSNQLIQLQGSPFESFTQLDSLYLHNNKLSSLGKDVFKGLTALTVLTLHANDLQSLPLDVFDHLPNLKRLYLYSNGLTQLNGTLFSKLNNLTRLSLFNNKITKLNTGTFESLPHLKELFLQSNSIETVEIGAFRKLTSLGHLHLESNKLSEVERGFLFGLYNLKTLHLEKNTIQGIPDGTFADSPNIRKLYLSNNALTKVSIFTFTELLTLVELDLSSNMISAIDGGSWFRQRTLTVLKLDTNMLSEITSRTFLNLYKLDELDLSSNMLRELPDEVFGGLESLRTLNLFGNEIAKIYCLSFKGLKKLHTLNLGYNEITWIADSAFSYSPELTYLHLYHNKLKAITRRTFRGLRKLFHLSLQCNAIEYIAANAFNDLKNLEEMIFVGDQCPSYLPCDCNCRWLQTWFKKNQVTLRRLNTIISCIDATDTQKMILDATDLDFKCRDPVLTVKASSEVVPVGGSVNLTCAAHPAARYYWQKGGKRFKPHAGASCLATHGILELKNMDSSKAGTYVCIAETEEWKAAGSVTVAVSQPPHFVDFMEDLTLDGPGGAAVFHCNVVGLPPPTVTWFRERQREIRELDRILFVGNYLVIKRVERGDQGAYRCVAKNKFDERVAQAVNLVVGSDGTCSQGCRNGGTCLAQFSCSCRTRYSGRYCQHDMGPGPDEGTEEPGTEEMSGSGVTDSPFPGEPTTEELFTMMPISSTQGQTTRKALSGTEASTTTAGFPTGSPTTDGPTTRIYIKSTVNGNTVPPPGTKNDPRNDGEGVSETKTGELIRSTDKTPSEKGTEREKRRARFSRNFWSA